MFGAGTGVGIGRARLDGGIVEELDKDVAVAIVSGSGAVVGIVVRSAGWAHVGNPSVGTGLAEGTGVFAGDRPVSKSGSAVGRASVGTIGVGRGGAEGIGDTVIVGRDLEIGISSKPGDDVVGVPTNGWIDVVNTFVGVGIVEEVDAPVDGCRVVEGVSVVVTGPGVSQNGAPVEGAVVGIGAVPTGWTDVTGSIGGGGVIENIGAVVAGSGDLESCGNIELAGVDTDMTGTRVESGAFDRPGGTTVGCGVSTRGAPVGSSGVGAGLVVNDGADDAWILLGPSVLDIMGAILDDTGIVVPGATVPK